MKEIPLTQGKVAIVDDCDFELVSKYKWYALKDGDTYYAARAIRISKGKQALVRLHRFLLNASDFLIVDHKDRDGLNNTRDNLRIANRSQNGANRKVQQKNTCNIKGVSLNKNRYRARIRVNGKGIHLGYFPTMELAGAAYLSAAKKYFGEFARTE